MSLNDIQRRAREFLIGRAGSYRRLFDPQNRDAQAVLEDLAKFCRAHETTFHADPRAHALAEGRREVFLRIAGHTNLTNDQLWLLYGGGRQPTKGE